MGKKFKKNPDGSNKPKRTKTGLGVWGVGAIFAAMLGLVGFTAKRENDAREAADSSLRGRLRRRPIEFSEHASCRMDCRFVSREEVEATLDVGRESKRHSTPGARPCPRWALQGRARPRDLGGVPGRDEARDCHRHRHGPPLRAVLIALRKDEREAGRERAASRNLRRY